MLVALMCGLAAQADARSVSSNVVWGVLGTGAAWLACSHLYTQSRVAEVQRLKAEHQGQLRDMKQQAEAFSKRVVALEQEKEQLTVELAQAAQANKKLKQKVAHVKELEKKAARVEELERELVVLRQQSEASMEEVAA